MSESAQGRGQRYSAGFRVFKDPVVQILGQDELQGWGQAKTVSNTRRGHDPESRPCQGNASSQDERAVGTSSPTEDCHLAHLSRRWWCRCRLCGVQELGHRTQGEVGALQWVEAAAGGVPFGARHSGQRVLTPAPHHEGAQRYTGICADQLRGTEDIVLKVLGRVGSHCEEDLTRTC